MSKLHVIGVGGTGHKVLSAAVHLAACGAFRGKLGAHEINEIRVLTIDADDANGNLTQTKNVIAAYRKFYDALGGAASLGLVGIEPVTEKLNVPLYHDDKKSISKTFNIPQYAGSDDDAFIRFLYSNDEIEAEFDQGFYGHTSIGTLIVKDILKESAVWKEQLNLINENDFVVIIGSIFGGTGASAIPVLIDELFTHKKDTPFKLAALLLNPYFKTAGEIKESGLLKPDAANFNIKAKAALHYYYKQNQYKKTDALYVIGESEQNFSIELASIGSANQKNKAHPVELFAASALIDFVRESGEDREGGGIITACRAEQKGQFCYTWKMLQDIEPHLPANIQNTVKAAIFYNKVLYGELKHGDAAGVWQSFYDNDLPQKRDSKGNLVYENIHKYLGMLASWFYDIHKRNKTEVNKSTGFLFWETDPRVKLFNANYANLFDINPVEGANIQDFDKLLYNDSMGNPSVKLYSKLCGKKPANGTNTGFADLFTTLLECASEEKKAFFGIGKKAPDPEKFETIPYLSRENDVTLGIPSATGKLWAKSEPKLLTDIAEGLPSSFSDSFTKNDLSIPSPWSIYIMNELTLTEDRFLSIHKTAFKEWCGIIALLVARKICRYENAGLRLSPLALGGGEFLNVVQSTLTPGSFVFDNQNWTQCHRVSLDGVTLAFLANNTLVCPAYTIDTVTRAKLHKIAPSIVGEHGDFLTPDNYFQDQSQQMNRDARYALRLFLDDLYAILTREAARNSNDIIKSLQELTKKYLGALGSVQKSDGIVIDPKHKDEVHSPEALFEKLCIAPNAANIQLPFLMDGTKKEAALIGLTICGISSGSAAAAHHLVTPNLVYNQITAASLGSYNNTTQDGILLLSADDLLCDGMVMVKKEGGAVFNAMPNASSRSDYEIIWPVSQALLDLYTPAALNSMLSLVFNAETVTVSLKIKLKGQILGSHTVTKEYHIKNRGDMNEKDTELDGMCCIMDKNLIPFWSAWPYANVLDTQGKNTWQRYTCFCVEPQYRGMPVLDIKPVFNEDGSFLVKENSLSTLKTVQQEYFYRRYTRLPSAFSVNEKTEGAPIYRGLVFMAEPKQVQAEASTWNVGVDFGTTSTTAFYTSSGGSAPTFIQLMDEYQWIEGRDDPEVTKYANDVVTLCDNSDDSKKWYFLDKQCFKQNGYATALEIMDIKEISPDAVLFDTHRIFWHNHENFRILNTQEGRKGRLLTNIKWDGDKSNSAKYLNQLLTQIVYHAALKGARTLNFFFSYPTAFGPDARNQFCGRLKDIVKLLADETGFTLNFNERNNLLTESIAAAYYFDWKNKKEKLFFCVDIGGGSTDASIWVEGKNIFQTSIHFASRDMFIKALRRLIEIKTVLKAVITDKNSDGLHMMLSDLTNMGSSLDLTGDKFKFLIETVLFEYYKPLRNRLDNLEGQDKTAFEYFKYCVYIAYSGLIYYLINTIAALFVSKKIDNDIPEMVLGLSGKGSKMTDWIASDIIYAEAERLLKEKTGLEIRINPQFKSETAKTETAIGMICNLGPDGRQKNQSALIEPCMYMGCAITAGNGKENRTIKEGEFIDTYNDTFFAEPSSLKIEFDKELKELEAFMSFFNKMAAKSRGDVLPLDAGFFEKQKKNLWSKIDKESKNALKEGRFEPPFILVLKVFLEEYAEECLWKKLN